MNGLADVHVYDIAQDHWGRMWFATRGGISCYDGVSWENYTMANGLPARAFVKISVDRKGRIWALSSPVQQGKFSVVFYDGSPGGAWHQIEELEVNILDPIEITSFQLIEQERKSKPIVVIGTAKTGLFRWQGGKWTKLTTKNGLLSNSVKGTAVWNGICYVAAENGISVLKNDGTMDNRLNRLLDFPSKKIKGICVEYNDKYPGFHLKDSRLWIYGLQWLGYLNLDESDNNKMVLFHPGISFSKEGETYNLQPDYRGGLYIGNLYDVYYFNYKTRTLESLHVINGLISEAAYSLFIDFEKNIWISCGRGVSKISSRMFSNFQMIHGLLEDEVTAVLEIEPGKFVLGHNRGLTFRDGNKFSQMPFSGEDGADLPFARVLDLQADSKQNIWVTAERVGVARIDKQKEIKWYGSRHGLPENIKVTSVGIDHTDNVWVGTGRGIFFMANNENRFVSVPVDKFPIPAVRKIYITTKNVLYLGSTFNGVYEYESKKNRWKNYRLPGRIGGNNVFAIKEDRRGRLLIGTMAGLFTLDRDQDTLKKFKEKNFEVHEPVYFIVEDHQHRLWFGTGSGVRRWDGVKESRYSLSEGLVGHETNRAAGIVDSSGRVWIGTNRGVSIYNEQFDDYANWKPRPKLRLLYIEVGDRKIPPDDVNPPVRLDYKTNTLIFHFRGVSFLDETAIRFKHKLEGFDREWLDEHYPFKQMIRYSNLPAGRYRFHLKVRNALGVWSEPVTSPELVILEPFYKRWWFYMLGFLSAIILFYGIFRFVLERRHAALLKKQVEERTNQLQALEKQYRSLFEESKDVVFISSPEGKLIDINPAGVELLGYRSKEEMVRLDSVLEFYYHPGALAAFREKIEKRGYVRDYEIIFKTREGEPLVGQMSATLVRDKQGNITAYRGILRDITEQKKLEQRLIQAQKMEAIGTLAGGIAHDFNNILSVIIGHGELMRDELAEGSQLRKSADQIVSSSERGAALVRQILAFSRQGKQKREPIDLVTIIKESLRLLQSILPTTIEIREETRVSSAIILADSTQVQQIMMNFGTNAAHAMRRKGGELEVGLDRVVLDAKAVKTYQDIKPGPYFRLTVGDTGHGMTREVVKRIFEPYFTTKKTGEGTGMGLAVIHGIVKSFGGDISVHSQPGKGATFHVFLPCLEEKEKVEKEIPLSEDIPGGTGRILLVDDEIALVDVGTRILKQLGYDVTGKIDAVEALETFRSDPERFDLIISDLTMPRMTGFQLAAAIQQIRPGIPIILCSGFTSPTTKKQLKIAGITDFITKPLNKSDLAKVVRDVLDGR
jgi:PAS domain S-box-containing protein